MGRVNDWSRGGSDMEAEVFDEGTARASFSLFRMIRRRVLAMSGDALSQAMAWYSLEDMVEGMHDDSFPHSLLGVSEWRNLRAVRLAIERVEVEVLVCPQVGQ